MQGRRTGFILLSMLIVILIPFGGALYADIGGAESADIGGALYADICNTPQSTELLSLRAEARKIEENTDIMPKGVQLVSIDMPGDIALQAEQRGRVESLFYDVADGEAYVNKVIYIYLPYDYEANDEKYNVIYLLHGSKGRPENYLDPRETTVFQNMLDRMIEREIIDPVIVAMPTYYSDAEAQSALSLPEQVKLVRDFPGELAQEIIPAVEEKYRTYAASAEPEDLAAARDHRAVGGFSLGGVATWYVMLQQMKLFRYYMPLSEASWDDGKEGISGINDALLSAGALDRSVAGQGYSAEDFTLLAVSGTRDAALKVMSAQMRALAFYGDIFRFGENTFYYIVIGGKHTHKDAVKYIFLVLQQIFA